MRVGLVSAPVNSPYYMSRSYVKNFGKPVLILFDYILVHGRMLKEGYPWFERYATILGRAIISYQFVEHEVGGIDILHFGPMIENGKGDVPCRDSFQFIKYMASQGSKGVSHGKKTLGDFKGTKKVMGTCLILVALGFSP